MLRFRTSLLCDGDCCEHCPHSLSYLDLQTDASARGFTERICKPEGDVTMALSIFLYSICKEPTTAYLTCNFTFCVYIYILSLVSTKVILLL